MTTAASHGIKTLGVIGAGQMGLGIAYVAALRAEIPSVLLCDASSAQLSKGLSFFDKLLAKDVSKGKISATAASDARARLSTVSDVDGFGAHAPDMVVEAATENLGVKQSIFGTLGRVLPAHAVLATNTSSISVSKIAASAGPAAAERTLGVHFFNPVPVMPLVELIPALQTRSDILAQARAFAEACGKHVTTSKDTPGFVSNRLLMPFINEAVVALETGIASKEDIDATLRLGMNHPMGPLTLADFIGLDTCLRYVTLLAAEFKLLGPA